MDDAILFPEIADYNSIPVPIVNSKFSRSRRRRMVKKAKKRLMKAGVDRGFQPSTASPSESLFSAIGLKGEVGDSPPLSLAKPPPPDHLAPLLSDPLFESSEIGRQSNFAPPPSFESSVSGVDAPMTAVSVPDKKRKRSAPPFSGSVGYYLRSRR